MDELREALIRIRWVVDETIKRIDLPNETATPPEPCNHKFKISIPSGPRDNNEFDYVCETCGHTY